MDPFFGKQSSRATRYFKKKDFLTVPVLSLSSLENPLPYLLLWIKEQP
jgi:hypothetical protein